jgi:hypothetical protein
MEDCSHNLLHDKPIIDYLIQLMIILGDSNRPYLKTTVRRSLIQKAKI